MDNNRKKSEESESQKINNSKNQQAVSSDTTQSSDTTITQPADTSAVQTADTNLFTTKPKDESKSSARWYVVHTYSGHESKVSQTLKQRIDSQKLQNKVMDILVPTQNK